ncbi:uncharacterized protein LOC136083079 [Hydra vulgaris]|uniref:Uncharacterized protein LOC136083079 n=1 Tax=Hydra vulgaris TaxID=6087 RepID=A0ABM4CA87_HYDVU
MNQICQHCGAKKFPEKIHFLSCHNGKVVLPPLSPFPQALQDLFTRNYIDNNSNANFFRYNRNYNACLFFASFTANVVQLLNRRPPCFRICGQVFHRIGNLRSDQDVPPKYCQLHIYVPLVAVNFRMQQHDIDLCLRGLMFHLHTIASEKNPFALAFKNMAEVEDEEICQVAIEDRLVSVVKISLLD